MIKRQQCCFGVSAPPWQPFQNTIGYPSR